MLTSPAVIPPCSAQRLRPEALHVRANALLVAAAVGRGLQIRDLLDDKEVIDSFAIKDVLESKVCCVCVCAGNAIWHALEEAAPFALS